MFDLNEREPLPFAGPSASKLIVGMTDVHKAIDWQDLLLPSVTNVVAGLGISLGIRSGLQPNIAHPTSPSFPRAYTKSIKIKTKTYKGDILFLRGWIPWQQDVFGVPSKKSTQNVKENSSEELSAKSSDNDRIFGKLQALQYRICLSDIMTGIKNRDYEFISCDGESIYFRIPVFSVEHPAFRLVFKVSMLASEEADKNNLATITTPRLTTDDFEKQIRETGISNVHSLINNFNYVSLVKENWENLCPIYFTKIEELITPFSDEFIAAVQQKEYIPLEVASYHRHPVTSDIDLRYIGVPKKIANHSCCTAAYNAREQKQELINALAEVTNLVKDELGYQINFNFEEKILEKSFHKIVKNMGCLTAFELMVICELNVAMKKAFVEKYSQPLIDRDLKEDFALGEIIQHGPDNRSPYQPCPFDKYELVIVGQSVEAVNRHAEQKSYATLALVTEERLAAKIALELCRRKKPIYTFMHANWNKELWWEVAREQWSQGYFCFTDKEKIGNFLEMDPNYHPIFLSRSESAKIREMISAYETLTNRERRSDGANYSESSSDASPVMMEMRDDLAKSHEEGYLHDGATPASVKKQKKVSCFTFFQGNRGQQKEDSSPTKCCCLIQ